MKKLRYLVMVLSAVFTMSLAACSGQQDKKSAQAKASETAQSGTQAVSTVASAHDQQSDSNTNS